MKTKNIIIAITALAVGGAANANEAVEPVSVMAGPIEVRADLDWMGTDPAKAL